MVFECFHADFYMNLLENLMCYESVVSDMRREQDIEVWVFNSAFQTLIQSFNYKMFPFFKVFII